MKNDNLKKIEELEQTITTASQQLEQLKAELTAGDKVELVNVIPRVGSWCQYFYVDGVARANVATDTRYAVDAHRHNHGNYFRAGASAENHRLRNESTRLTHLMPKFGEVYWRVLKNDDGYPSSNATWNGRAWQIDEYLQGRTGSSREMVEEKIKLYGSAWLAVPAELEGKS